jgi:hypothetical protein
MRRARSEEAILEVLGEPPPTAPHPSTLRLEDALHLIAELKKKLGAAREELWHLRDEKKANAVKVRAQGGQIKVLKEELSARNAWAKEKEGELQERKQALKDLERRARAAERCARSSGETGVSTTMVADARRRQLLAESQARDANEAMHALEIQLSATDSRLSALSLQLSQAKEELQRSKNWAAGLSKEVDELRPLKQQYEETSAALVDAERNLTESQRQLEASNEELRLSKDLVDAAQRHRERLEAGGLLEVPREAVHRMQTAAHDAQNLQFANESLKGQTLVAAGLLQRAQKDFVGLTDELTAAKLRIEELSDALSASARECNQLRAVADAADRKAIRQHAAKISVEEEVICAVKRSEEKAILAKRAQRALENVVRSRQEQVEARNAEKAKRRRVEERAAALTEECARLREEVLTAQRERVNAEAELLVAQGLLEAATSEEVTASASADHVKREESQEGLADPEEEPDLARKLLERCIFEYEIDYSIACQKGGRRKLGKRRSLAGRCEPPLLRVADVGDGIFGGRKVNWDLKADESDPSGRMLLEHVQTSELVEQVAHLPYESARRCVEWACKVLNVMRFTKTYSAIMIGEVRRELALSAAKSEVLEQRLAAIESIKSAQNTAVTRLVAKDLHRVMEGWPGGSHYDPEICTSTERRLTYAELGLGDIGIKRIVEELSQGRPAESCTPSHFLWCPLEWLSLSNSHISDAGASALAKLIEGCPALKHVDLRNNHIGMAGKASIRMAMERRQGVAKVEDTAPPEVQGPLLCTRGCLPDDSDVKLTVDLRDNEELTVWPLPEQPRQHALQCERKQAQEELSTTPIMTKRRRPKSAHAVLPGLSRQLGKISVTADTISRPATAFKEEATPIATAVTRTIEWESPYFKKVPGSGAKRSSRSQVDRSNQVRRSTNWHPPEDSLTPAGKENCATETVKPKIAASEKKEPAEKKGPKSKARSNSAKLVNFDSNMADSFDAGSEGVGSLLEQKILQLRQVLDANSNKDDKLDIQPVQSQAPSRRTKLHSGPLFGDGM